MECLMKKYEKHTVNVSYRAIIVHVIPNHDGLLWFGRQKTAFWACKQHQATSQNESTTGATPWESTGLGRS